MQMLLGSHASAPGRLWEKLGPCGEWSAPGDGVQGGWDPPWFSHGSSSAESSRVGILGLPCRSCVPVYPHAWEG